MQVANFVKSKAPTAVPTASTRYAIHDVQIT